MRRQRAAEADSGDDEAPPDEESDDGSGCLSLAASPALPPAGPLPTPLRPATDWQPPAWECRGGGNSLRFTGFHLQYRFLQNTDRYY
jgi:hypothetical protein